MEFLKNTSFRSLTWRQKIALISWCARTDFTRFVIELSFLPALSVYRKLRERGLRL